MGRKYCLTRVYMHLKFAGRNESWDCLAPCVLHVPASCASGYLCSAHVFGPTYSTPLAQKRPLLGPTGEENFSKTLDTNCLMRSFEWPTGVGGADPPSKRMRACLTPGADRRTGEAGWISSSLSVSLQPRAKLGCVFESMLCSFIVEDVAEIQNTKKALAKEAPSLSSPNPHHRQKQMHEGTPTEIEHRDSSK